VTPPSGRSAGRRYLAEVRRLIGRLEAEEWEAVAAAADLVADTLARGGTIHAFGTGHSHMLAEELYYRAGGFVRVSPILFEGLMLHADAPLSTALERVSGVAEALLGRHPMHPGDVLIIASNSGGNAVVRELAGLARQNGIPVIAVVSRAHASSSLSRSAGGTNLVDLATVVIDNGGALGDAAVSIEGSARRAGPTSTVIGAAALNAIVAEAAERLAERGVDPALFVSSNVEGADEINAELLRGETRR
jgi:uncharacterized phosphosugar-binding protein